MKNKVRMDFQSTASGILRDHKSMFPGWKVDNATKGSIVLLPPATKNIYAKISASSREAMVGIFSEPDENNNNGGMFIANLTPHGLHIHEAKIQPVGTENVSHSVEASYGVDDGHIQAVFFAHHHRQAPGLSPWVPVATIPLETEITNKHLPFNKNSTIKAQGEFDVGGPIPHVDEIKFAANFLDNGKDAEFKVELDVKEQKRPSFFVGKQQNYRHIDFRSLPRIISIERIIEELKFQLTLALVSD